MVGLRLFVAVFLCGAMCAAPVVAQQRGWARSPQVGVPKQAAPVERSLLRLVNRERVLNRLKPLKVTPALTFVARRHCANMCVAGVPAYESKRFPTGWTTTTERMKLVKLDRLSEIVGVSTEGEASLKQRAAAIFEAWLHDPGTRKRFLAADVLYGGAGAYTCGAQGVFMTLSVAKKPGRVP